MVVGRSGTKCAAAVLFCLMALGLSACDPGHPYEDVQLKIFSNGDGQATMSVEVNALATNGTRVDESAFLDALARELAFGEVAGPAVVPPDSHSHGPAIQLTGVDQQRLTVSLSPVLEVMNEFGLGDDATVFVSVCTSARSGTASGNSVELAHRSSCATWEPTPRPATTDATATLTFASRSSVSQTSTLLAFLFAGIGITAAAVFVMTSKDARTVAFTCSIIGIVASIGVVASAVSSLVQRDDTWFETGQTFDASFSEGYARVVRVALIGGAALPAAALMVGAVVHHRSNRKPSTAPRDGATV